MGEHFIFIIDVRGLEGGAPLERWRNPTQTIEPADCDRLVYRVTIDSGWM
jgi:hypothetical protein